MVEWDHGLFKGKDREEANVFRAGECGGGAVRELIGAGSGRML